MADMLNETIAPYKTVAEPVFELVEVDTNEYTLKLKNEITQAGTIFGPATVASQAEAEAGTANDKMMTPIRVLQSIAANTPTPDSPFTILTSQTIPSTGWGASSSDYAYELSFAITGLLTTDIVKVYLDKDSQDIAQAAELSSSNDSTSGYLVLYANNVPTESMTADIEVLHG